MNQRRRRLLKTGAGALALGLAGCSSGNGGGGTDTEGGDGDGNDGGGGDATPADALGAPVAGSADASVTVMSFEDYGCPHCARYNERVYPKVESEFISSGDIRYEHRDFPLPVTSWSRPMAYAARSVQAQAGHNAFYEFSKGAFAKQDQHSESLVKSLASDAGADGGQTVSDMNAKAYKSVVDADKQKGKDMGVRGTPTVFVGDTQVSGGNWDEFWQDMKAKIENQL